MRDFSLIFDALTTFEEALLAARMGSDEADAEPAENGDEDADGRNFMLRDPGSDIDLRWVLIELRHHSCMLRVNINWLLGHCSSAVWKLFCRSVSSWKPIRKRASHVDEISCAGLHG